MSDTESPKLHYKRKAPKAEAREAAFELAKVSPPVPALRNTEILKKGPGRKPDVVRDFGPSDPKAIKLKGFMVEGLSAKEAGIMAGYSAEQMDALQKKSSAFRRFVEKALIEYKHHHLKVIKDRKDPKTSQWMLEKTFPEEFAMKPKDLGNAGSERSSTTVINAIFKSVQGTPDNLVPESVTVYEHENGGKKKQDDNTQQEPGRPEPSLNAGGANIL